MIFSILLIFIFGHLLANTFSMTKIAFQARKQLKSINLNLFYEITRNAVDAFRFRRTIWWEVMTSGKYRVC